MQKRQLLLDLLSLLILVWVMSGCEETQQIVLVSGSSSVELGLVLAQVLQPGTQYGAELAAFQINAQGGVLGAPLELIFRDNQDDAALTVQLAEELITQRQVIGLIGPNYSHNAMSMALVAQRFGVPMVATTATNPRVTEAGDFVFLAAFADIFQGEVLASFARTTLQAQTAAILTQVGEPYSEGLSGSFRTHFLDLGGTVVLGEGLAYFAEDLDFSPQLSAIALEDPDVVFVPGFVPEVPAVVRQARDMGLDTVFLGGDGWEDSRLISQGGAALEGSFFSSYFSPQADNESTREFVKAYRERFGNLPDGAAAMGYDAVRLVVTAIRRAGTLDHRAIRDEIEATHGYEGATAVVRYDTNRHPQKGAAIIAIRDGRFQLHQQITPEP